MMSKVQTVFRVAKNRDNPYVMLNKKFLEHSNLSYRAKGILAYILSKPDYWKLTVSDLVKHGKEGRDAIYSTLHELIQRGFIQHICYRKNGKISYYEYIVYEQPLTTPIERITYTSITETRVEEKRTRRTTTLLPEILETDLQEGEEALLALSPEIPEVAQQHLETPAANQLPENPDSEKPTLVINDFNNKLINNKKHSSSTGCAILELWEDTFSVCIRDWEQEALLKVSSRSQVLKTICLIQEHHNISSIQSPFAFVYSCVTNGGYSVPQKASKPFPVPRYQEKKRNSAPVPKVVQRQWEGKHLESRETSPELAAVKARIRERIQELYGEGLEETR